MGWGGVGGGPIAIEFSIPRGTMMSISLLMVGVCWGLCTSTYPHFSSVVRRIVRSLV